VKLSEEHKIRLIRGIAAGMLHLHSHNIIIHRDLAAKNILLTENRQPKISVLSLLFLFHFI
jgi:serine/threonine protein kinase